VTSNTAFDSFRAGPAAAGGARLCKFGKCALAVVSVLLLLLSLFGLLLPCQQPQGHCLWAQCEHRLGAWEPSSRRHRLQLIPLQQHTRHGNRGCGVVSVAHGHTGQCVVGTRHQYGYLIGWHKAGSQPAQHTKRGKTVLYQFSNAQPGTSWHKGLVSGLGWRREAQ
jgi:hypothetical protein